MRGETRVFLCSLSPVFTRLPLPRRPICPLVKGEDEQAQAHKKQPDGFSLYLNLLCCPVECESDVRFFSTPLFSIRTGKVLVTHSRQLLFFFPFTHSREKGDTRRRLDCEMSDHSEERSRTLATSLLCCACRRANYHQNRPNENDTLEKQSESSGNCLREHACQLWFLLPL